MDTSTLIDRPHCPRCRYEVGGVIASWREQCPLGGTCPECGLTFDWPDVLRVDRQRDERFIEHTSKWWRLPTAAWRTWVLVLTPQRFWSRVSCRAERGLTRAFAWLILTVVPFWLIHSALSSVQMYDSRPTVWVGMSLVAPGTATRPTPALREWVLCWTQPLVGIEYSDWARPRFRPLWPGAGSIGVIWDLWPSVIRALLAMQVVWPLMILVLRATRRAAGVRTIDVGRAWLYSLAWLPVLVAIALSVRVFALVSKFSPHVCDVLDRSVWGLAIVAFVPWSMWWWRTLTVHAWRLRRAKLVWIVLTIPTLFCAVIAYLWP